MADRPASERELKVAYRRLFVINRRAEQLGRVPDFDRYVHEREYERLLWQIASDRKERPR